MQRQVPLQDSQQQEVLFSGAAALGFILSSLY